MYKKRRRDFAHALRKRHSTEAWLKRLVTALALLSSIASLIVIAGGGLALLAIQNSGERGTGALLAIGCAVAFAALLALVVAKRGAFGGGIWKAAAIGLAVMAAIPPAVLAYAAIRFAGFPMGSRMPLVDWSVFGVGLLFGLGVVSILALGHRRSQEKRVRPEERSGTAEDLPPIHMQQIRHAQQQMRSAFEADRRRLRLDDDEDDIRVRHV